MDSPPKVGSLQPKLLLSMNKYCTWAQNRRQTNVTRAAAQAKPRNVARMSYQGELSEIIKLHTIVELMGYLPSAASFFVSLILPVHVNLLQFQNHFESVASCTTIVCRKPHLGQVSRLMVCHSGSSGPDSRGGQADDYENLRIRISSALIWWLLTSFIFSK